MPSHMTLVVLLLAVGLRAVWKAPDWGLKVVALAYAIRQYREDGHPSPASRLQEP